MRGTVREQDVRTKDGGMPVILYLSVTEKGVDSKGLTQKGARVKKGTCVCACQQVSIL